MLREYANLDVLIARIKREAKKLKRAERVTHSAALERLARTSGFRSCTTSRRKPLGSQHSPAISIVAIDDDEFEEFEANGPQPFAVDSNLAKELKHRWLKDTQPWNNKPMAVDLSLMGGLTFLRFTGEQHPSILMRHLT